ncbi:MAG: response regulator [Myxococcaceae bacterium]
MGYVLVVDDDDSHRTLLRDMLSEMGYSTQAASNGREALERISAKAPDALVLDLRMPTLSGWGVLENLRRMGLSKLALIVIVSQGFEWEAKLVGAKGLFSKPFDLERVRAVAHDVLGPPQEEVP